MKATVAAAAHASVHDKSVIEISGAVVEDVLTHVRELSGASETMRGQGNGIRLEIEALLNGMQYQDRVNQVIAVVDGDLDRLREAVAGNAGVPNAAEWLDVLKSKYSCAEHHDSHTSNAVARRSPRAAQASTGVEFF
jgi:hypothetical protein